MKRILLVCLLVLTSLSLIEARGKNGLPSPDTPDSLLNIWRPSLVTGLNISQIAFSNWEKGGENSLTWTLFGDATLKYETKAWLFSNQLNIAYGKTKLGEEDFKTNDNEFFFESMIQKYIGWFVEPYFSASFRTQLDKNYDYEQAPPVAQSDLLDPFYVTQELGFAYKPIDQVTTRLGVSFKETAADTYTKFTDDPDTPNEIETFKFETGISSVTKTDFVVAENLQYKSELRLFSRFERVEVWDVRWDNNITAKVNSWLNVNLTAIIVYEHDVRQKTQVKEALQLGIVYNIF